MFLEETYWLVSALFDWRLYIVIAALYVSIFYIRVACSGLPPGPLPLPLLGNIPQLGSQMHLSFSRIRKKYKDVFTVYIATQPVVVLTSHESVREAFVMNSDKTSGRPRLPVTEWIHQGQHGLAEIDGSFWKEERQFAHRVLRDLGMGRPVLEEKRKKEAATLVVAIRAENEQPFDPAIYLTPAVSNIICCLLYGHRFDYDDSGFVDILHNFDSMMKSFWKMMPLNIIPMLFYLPGDLFGFHAMKKNVFTIWEWVGKQIMQKTEEYDGQNHYDFITYYLRKLNDEGKHKERENVDKDKQLLAAVMDLFFAGTETTTATLRWAFLYLLHHPDVQQKVQHEIDSVIGQHRPPCWNDRNSMPYTEAVLSEVNRIGSIVPTGIMHLTTSDVVICGHHIPKGAWLLSDIYNIHHDCDYWKSPEIFDPRRFLGSAGSKAAPIIPFSMGPRVCLGEGLARMELFLFLTTLLQHFSLEAADHEGLPSTAGELGITLLPVPYELVMRNRS